jgi:hypothetical protein
MMAPEKGSYFSWKLQNEKATTGRYGVFQNFLEHPPLRAGVALTRALSGKRASESSFSFCEKSI